ncbi:hypothetical protein DL98DRAFT_436205, partial [Cadophora sp. DSE1049]
KNNTLVLSISIYSNTQGKVKKLRKRLSETSTLVKTARIPFRIHACAWLKIPKYENDYNY